MRALVIAPHPDDEVLGVGGTIHRLAAAGDDVTVAIVTKGWEPLFPTSQVDQVRREARAANEILGTRTIEFLDLPVTKLHALAEHELNATFEKLVSSVEPEWVFIPFAADRHEDHRQVFDASMVALRPAAGRPPVRKILAYETVSETHWTAAGIEPVFAPQMFIDVSDHLSAKLDALKCYQSQVQPFPSSRSIESVSALARWRGSTVGMKAAEAFCVIRESLGGD